MPRLLLPPQTALRSAAPVSMVMRDGRAVLSQEITYPAFFVHRESVVKHFPDHERLKSRYSELWPAMPTEQGLVWDPDWNAFAAFFLDKYRRSESERLLADIEKRKVDWALCCPVVEGPESMIGQVMRMYGHAVGAIPGSPGFNPTQAMSQFPIAALLRKAKGLEDFRDRGKSLLDLAMHYQLWDAAEWLWERGVRPTPQALQGPFLESLVLASYALQESPATGFLPGQQDRIQWLDTWLARFEQTQSSVSLVPFSTWRQRALDKNMGVRDHLPPIVDSAPALWISHCIHARPNRAPVAGQDAHQTEFFDTWVRFWTRQGVDLDTLPVQTWAHDPVEGFSAYAAAQRPSETWQGWQDRLTMVCQAEQLAQSTPTAPSPRAAPRL